jgi:hypothetical protein
VLLLIIVSIMTVRRRCDALGLYGSSKTTKLMSEVTKRQIVLDAMAKDPSSRIGPRRMQEKITMDTNLKLTQYVLSATYS